MLAPLSERLLAEVDRTFGQDVEGDEPGRRGRAEHLDPGIRRVDPLLEGAEVQAVFGHDDDLAVEDDLLLAQAAQGGQELGKVARHRAGAAADQLDAVAVAENEGAKSVPLGLVLPAVALRNARFGGRGEHRLHVGRDGKLHAGCPHVSISCGYAYTVLPYRRPVNRPCTRLHAPTPTLRSLRKQASRSLQVTCAPGLPLYG